MKVHKNSLGASALQITLGIALLFSFAIVLASTMKATGPASLNKAAPQVVDQPGFYPPLPARNLPPPLPDRNPHVTPTPQPPPTCTPIQIMSKISTADSKENGRVKPLGTASSCGAPNSCSLVPGLYHYRDYSFNNSSGADRCVTVTLITQCVGDNALFSAAYVGEFDPSNPCTNLVGDSGVVSSGSNLTYSFTVPSGAEFTVVVDETVPDAGCQLFELDIDGLCGPPPSPSPTPAPSPTPPDRISQLTPTNVSCDQFLSGNAPSLSGLEYSLKGNPATINQVDPGVFFYWCKVQAQAGTNTFTVNESIITGNFTTLFPIAAGTNVFTDGCETVHPTFTQSGGVITAQFNAASAGTYVISVKFQTQALKGAAAPSPGTTVSYAFTTSGVAGSDQGTDMVQK
jgi:hypothetical protein